MSEVEQLKERIDFLEEVVVSLTLGSIAIAAKGNQSVSRNFVESWIETHWKHGSASNDHVQNICEKLRRHIDASGS